LFAQRRNVVRPGFFRLVAEILRFFRAGQRFLAASPGDEESLAAFLDRHGFSLALRRYYLAPMLAAIWSADPARVFDFPARHFLAFFQNHGLLQATGGPTWRVVDGGSARYVEKLTAGFRQAIRTDAPVEAVWRDQGGVWVKTPGGVPEAYDQVIIAAHSDEALDMLASPTRAEREVLGAIPYQRNEVVLHTDTRLLPRTRRAWASWNVRVPEDARGAVSMTYDMNRLQGIHDAPETFCVTLNDTGAIDPRRVLRTFEYSHPVFSRESVAAQARHHEISGGGIHFCGAYWGYGFHEDGVVSALRVCDAIRAMAGGTPERETVHAQWPLCGAGASPALQAR
jgi:predicted NAD/FAD-binding protein